MKKILLAILLILSLSLMLVACIGNGGNGELSTGEQGTKDDGGNWNNPGATLAPGETLVPGEGGTTTTPSDGSQIENAGANTEGGWSEIHGPNSNR